MLEDNPSASAYLTWEYSQALCQTYHYRQHHLGYTTNSGHLVGGLPLIHVKSLFFGDRLISLPFCEYGGPLLAHASTEDQVSHASESLLNQAIQLASQLGVDYVEMRHPSLNESILLQKGFEKAEHYVTFHVDLSNGTKQLWNSLDKKTRNAVRKSQKAELQIKDVNELDQLREYYTLYLETQKRLGSPPHCFQLFENLFSVFCPTNKMRMILARHDNMPIAGIVVFLHGNSVFWWNNVSNAEYRKLNPTNLLLWHAMEWAAEKGYRTMNLGRTRKSTTIYDFKKGWGGEEKPLQDFVHFVASKKKNLPDPSQKKYQVLSAIWDLLPIAVSRRIGPRIIKGIGL